MDKFEQFLADVTDGDPAFEAVAHNYTQLRHGQLYKPLVVPDSVRSVTVDPRSDLSNKIVTPTIDGTGAPTLPCTTSMAGPKRDPHEETTKEWQKPPKPQQIKTTPNKQIQELMKKAEAHIPNPVQFTKTYSEQVPTCGYTIKAGFAGPGAATINGCSTDAGGGNGGGGGAASTSTSSGGAEG